MQSLVPHAQSLALAALPSVTVHATNAHVLTTAVQNRPLNEVQSLVPHAQSLALAALPSVTAQVATQLNFAFSTGLYADDEQS